jgi:hypothetical protein
MLRSSAFILFLLFANLPKKTWEVRSFTLQIII